MFISSEFDSKDFADTQSSFCGDYNSNKNICYEVENKLHFAYFITEKKLFSMESTRSNIFDLCNETHLADHLLFQLLDEDLPFSLETQRL